MDSCSVSLLTRSPSPEIDLGGIIGIWGIISQLLQRQSLAFGNYYRRESINSGLCVYTG
jgi:hypothetical protein